MSSKNKAIRDFHAKMYIDAVFADTLKQEGFINPDGKSISWYRVVNNELIHAIYFHATWGRIPVDGTKIESKAAAANDLPERICFYLANGVIVQLICDDLEYCHIVVEKGSLP